MFGDAASDEFHKLKLERERKIMNTTQWTKIVTPERYLKTWPNGPEAALALRLTKGIPNSGDKIKFFSPRSAGLSIVVESKKWIKTQTPGGEMTLQTPGIVAEFSDGRFETDDETIIEYLTSIYKDKRFPVVRPDMPTKSSATI